MLLVLGVALFAIGLSLPWNLTEQDGSGFTGVSVNLCLRVVEDRRTTLIERTSISRILVVKIEGGNLGFEPHSASSLQLLRC